MRTRTRSSKGSRPSSRGSEWRPRPHPTRPSLRDRERAGAGAPDGHHSLACSIRLARDLVGKGMGDRTASERTEGRTDRRCFNHAWLGSLSLATRMLLLQLATRSLARSSPSLSHAPLSLTHSRRSLRTDGHPFQSRQGDRPADDTEEAGDRPAGRTVFRSRAGGAGRRQERLRMRKVPS